MEDITFVWTNKQYQRDISVYYDIVFSGAQKTILNHVAAKVLKLISVYYALTSRRNIVNALSFFFIITNALPLWHTFNSLTKLPSSDCMLRCWILLISDFRVRNLVILVSFPFESLYTFIFFQIPSAIAGRSFLYKQLNESIRLKPTSSLPANGHAVIFFQKLHLVTDRAFLQDFSELLEKVEAEKKSNKDKMLLWKFHAISYRTPWSDSFLSLNEYEESWKKISRNALKELHFAGWLFFLYQNSLIDSLLVGPCRVSGGYSSISECGGPCMTIGQFMWNVWKEKIVLEWGFLRELGFFLLVF